MDSSPCTVSGLALGGSRIFSSCPSAHPPSARQDRLCLANMRSSPSSLTPYSLPFSKYKHIPVNASISRLFSPVSHNDERPKTLGFGHDLHQSRPFLAGRKSANKSRHPHGFEKSTSRTSLARYFSVVLSTPQRGFAGRSLVDL